MEVSQYPWFQALSLKEEDFQALPEGEEALVWGLENRKIDEVQFQKWSSQFYQIPTPKSTLQQFSFDPQLIAKYKNIYSWNELIYPIYEWQDTLYVICLEPPRNGINYKCCFIATPYSELVSLSSLFETDEITGTFYTIHPKQSETTEDKKSLDEPPVTMTEEMEDLTPVQSISSAKEKEVELPPDSPAEESSQEPVAEVHRPEEQVDLSENKNKPALEDLPPQENSVEDSVPSENTTEMTGDGEEKQELSDIISIDFTDLKTEVGIEAASPQSEEALHQETSENIEPKSEPPSKENDGSLDFSSLDVQKPSSENENSPEKTSEEDIQPSENSDEYTPVEKINQSIAQKTAEANHSEVPPVPSKMTPDKESSITDYKKPISTPDENLMTEDFLKKTDDLEDCTNMKQIIGHIFGHLTKDYQKLMWVQKSSDLLFFPKYVYGDWKILTLAWRMHINLTNPNVFRVPYKSSLPYHGEIHPNPYNSKYFEWWTQGEAPQFITIYPVIIEEELIGFITAFGKNDEFDSVKSLKKIENLVSLCRNYLNKHKPVIAA